MSKEEDIITIRINSEDLFLVFGWLSLLSKGVPLPKEMTRDVVMETLQKVVNLNIKNKEFLEAVKK